MTALVAKDDTVLATAFVDNQIGHLHPVFAETNSRYSFRLEEYMPCGDPLEETSLKKQEDDFTRHAERCKQAMDAFRQKRQSPTTSQSAVDEKTTWTDVLKGLEDAKWNWENSAKGVRGQARKRARVWSENARVVDAWLVLLPSSDYGSVMCGGLKLVLGGIIAKADMQEAILECVDSLPETVHQVNSTLQLYSKLFDRTQEIRLQKAVLCLSGAILDVILAAISWLEKGLMRKLVGALVKQSEYPNDFRNAAQRLEQQSSSLRNLAGEFQQILVAKLLAMASQSSSQSVEMRKGFDDVNKKLIAESESKTGLLRLLEGWIANVRWDAKIERQKQDLLLDEIRELKSRPNTPLPPPATTIHQQVIQVVYQPPPALTKEAISSFLNIDVLLLREAFNQAGTDSIRNSPESSKLIQQIMKKTQFRDWFQSTDSGLVVLRRKASNNNKQMARALGFVAATLAATLSDQTHAAILYFFCPTVPSSLPPDSCYLLRSLIRQLLQHSDTAVSPDMLWVSTFDPHHLRDLFFHILCGMPFGQTIFIFIHGLYDYERANKAEVDLLLRLFCELDCLSLERDLRVKILLTPPTPQVTSSIVPFEKYVELPEDDGNLREFSTVSMVKALGDICQ
ncbi:hypothetical protein K458DRAFT_405626 [Lentithecium fluviatile CBS 122367]|uniref:DUF7708 domain-containing protein n=1 Tax=Lentithecium fluviatile CBS 122367 TaxID=1168545 RepID=A0A6G1IWH4_9PLEO|nr:hypothetical protein K458DRAFT_405626 [Lentithecium fluviatile CBS 122367]